MKRLTFICSSKGGSGKSFITFFIAKALSNDENSIFIDLDKSTRTSYNRLGKVISDDRVLELSILDDFARLDREAFINIMDKISNADFETFFMDLGAPESDEFLTFLKNDCPPSEFKEIAEELGLDVTILVPIAGGDALDTTVTYYKQLAKISDGNIKVQALKNEGTFKSLDAMRIAEVTLQNDNIIAKSVCAMPVGNSANEIINLVAGRVEEENLTFAGKRTLRKIVDSIKTEILA